MHLKTTNGLLMRYRAILLLFFLLSSSCAPSRKIIYLSDLQGANNYSEEIKNKIEPVIQPYDQLSITVSSLSSESNLLFNSGVLMATGNASGTGGTTQASAGYLVGENGTINFPVLGKVKLADLTIEQAATKMTDEIKKSVKNPIINVRFLNFKITVLGEVTRPSTFTVPSGKINILEAISLAGDLTAYGKRENILIIREKDSIRSITRVDLTSKAILNSPNFYLQQNDVIYVEPAKAKILQSSSSGFYLSLVVITVSILSTLVVLLR
jgi:polysaccharide export outer membrane protein